MKSRKMKIVFSSAISHLVERNTSFDAGIMRVAYTGKNRNNSFISKETYEKCISTIYNCPIVCNYNRDDNAIGSHDVELVSDADGNMKIVNVTQPVGVVPESANYWWEEIEDDSGVHEYLCVDVLLWKRQEAYQKIKDNGITDESMEITIQDGEMHDGVYVINRFEFTAFCLLETAEPCFESASLEVFSCGDFKKQLADMMQEFKELLALEQSSNEVVINVENNLEGGEKVLNEKIDLMNEFGLTKDDLPFDIGDFSLEELREKFEALKNEDSENSGSESESLNVDKEFELDNQFMQELFNALEAEIVDTDFGAMPRYWYVNCDRDASEVYAEDYNDHWNLYGFPYSMNGDKVVIDFSCKKRKKYSIVDFDEGEQNTPTANLFKLFEKKFSDANTEWSEKYQKALSDIAANTDELTALRQYKTDVESSIEKGKKDDVFAKFEDLSGVDAFTELRKDAEKYSIEELEEKCFAIRGRQGVPAKFSAEQKTPKLPVEKREIANEPYGGVFIKYGIA